MNVEYRKAKFEDALQMSLLLSQVYIHTYAKQGVALEFALAIKDQFNTPRIEAEILGNESCFWIATYNESPIAILKTYWDKACPNQSFSAPEIHKLYMLNQFYGQGIAQVLLHHGEKELREAGHKVVWLWVLEKNYRAVRFYEKENYRPIGKADLQLSENSYTNTIMIKEL